MTVEKKMSLNERIKEIRKKLNYSQHELAELIGVSQMALSKWERGERQPSKANIRRLCEITGRPFTYFIEEEEEGEEYTKLEKLTRVLYIKQLDALKTNDMTTLIDNQQSLPVLEDSIETEDYSKEEIRQRFRAIRIVSQNALGQLNTGDILITITVKDIEAENIYIVKVKNNYVLVKTTLKDENGFYISTRDNVIQSGFYTEKDLVKQGIEFLYKVIRTYSKPEI